MRFPVLGEVPDFRIYSRVLIGRFATCLTAAFRPDSASTAVIDVDA